MLVGEWRVDVAAHRLQCGERSVALEPRTMAVLQHLCRHATEVVSAEQLLQSCWAGEPLGDNPVHKVIAALRQAFGDSAREPRYIETLRRRGYRLVAPVRWLSGEGPRGHAGSWRGRSPFRGLAAFDRAHADVFFGRDAMVATLCERLHTQWQRGWPLVVLLGPSGSGKTSLVHAGLLPALEAGPISGAELDPAPAAADLPLQVCATATLDLGDAEAGAYPSPAAALAGALLDWDVDGEPLLRGHSIDSLTAALNGHAQELWQELLAGGAERQPPLLVVDRLEALFQRPDERDARFVIDTLASLAESRCALLLAVCRNDFYARLASFAPLMRDKDRGAHVDLQPPGPDAIAQIIRLPARAAGLVYGSDASGLNRLDDRLLADAQHTGDALPLLQYTLEQLYLQRGAGDELQWAAYQSMGGLDGAIGRAAEATLAALPASRQAAFARVLPRLVSLAGEDAQPTARWLPAHEAGHDDERAVIQALVDARLLVADELGGQPGVRVAHEALLRRWPRVTAWIAQHRAHLALRDELQPWLQRWLDGARSTQLLLPRGATLWQAGTAVAESPQLFSAEAREFIQRSAARLTRQKRNRQLALAGALLLAVGGVLAALQYARVAQLAAEREQQSRRLVSYMLGDLADQLRPLGRLELLEGVARQGLHVMAEASEGNESAADVVQRAKALVAIGEVYSSRGKGRTDVAEKALHQAQDLLRPLTSEARGPAAADLHRTAGAAAFWLGQIAFDAGRLDEAAAQMARYRAINEAWLKANPGNAEARRELAYAMSSQGSIATRRMAWAEAESTLRAALALKLDELRQRPDDADARSAVVNARAWLGRVDIVLGRPADALLELDPALQMQAQLVQAQPVDASRRFDLGSLQVRRAEALSALGRSAAALEAIDDAVAQIGLAAAADPGNAYWQAEYAHVRVDRALLRLDTAHPPGDLAQTLAAPLRAALQRTPNDPIWNAVALKLQALAAAQALQHLGPDQRPDTAAQRADALAAADAVQQAIATQLDGAERGWHLYQLEAWLALRRLQTLPATVGQPMPWCSRSVQTLKPAVDAGQAGLVRKAWPAVQSCASGTAPTHAVPAPTADFATLPPTTVGDMSNPSKPQKEIPR